MQSVSSRIWTRVAVFISYDDNHYTTGTSNGNHSNDSIIKIGQNTKKSHGEFRRLVSQTPVRNHQLTIEWKILKRVK